MLSPPLTARSREGTVIPPFATIPRAVIEFRTMLVLLKSSAAESESDTLHSGLQASASTRRLKRRPPRGRCAERDLAGPGAPNEETGDAIVKVVRRNILEGTMPHRIGIAD